jgi:hypothetical protein
MSNEPFTRFYNLADLSDAGYEKSIVTDEEDRARLAEWAEVEAVESFEGRVELTRVARDRFEYDAHLEAVTLQSCVVTLAPVRTHISKDFHRVLHLMPGAHRFADKGGAITLAAGDDDAPEEIESSRYDLAGPLIEELVLSVDPYPRAAGVSFESPVADVDKPESPFAVLGKLKQQG